MEEEREVDVKKHMDVDFKQYISHSNRDKAKRN